MSTCIFTWFSEPLNHKRRFSTFLHNRTKENENASRIEKRAFTQNLSLATFIIQKLLTFSPLLYKFAISWAIFLRKEEPNKAFERRSQKGCCTEVVLFGSFLRICHCAKLMERLGLAALLCRGAFFARSASSPRLDTVFENHSKCGILIFVFWHFPPLFVL